ncbi:hypothetical protein L7F22_027229 [Adiantum nelumboides]|nr:hypothetical protein [Adiantum nelumboides]
MTSTSNPQTFIYKTVSQNSSNEKVEIPLDIYLPKQKHQFPPKPLIWIHTGGFLQGTRKFLPPHFQRACDRLNLALITPDYRLAPQVDIEGVLEDVKDSIRFTLSNEGLAVKLGGKDKLDTSQYILAGSSAGGWASLLQGLGFTNSNDIPAPLAVIAIYPITTISKDRAPYFHMPLKPLPWAYNLQAKIGDLVPVEPLKPHMEKDGKVLTEAPPLVLTSRAPLYSYARQEGIYPDLILSKGQNAEKYCLPSLIEELKETKNTATKLVFIAYGDADPMVEIHQSKEVIEALKKANLSFEVGSYIEPGKSHLWDILDPEADIPELWQKVAKLL